jgi:glycosyltransferase involved in cell wall biosynthesis
MVLTVAVSTHGGYARYLDECVASAREFADEVIVYDDGGECDPPAGVRYVALEKSGFCTAARQRGIREATGDNLLHLDGDDWLVARPPEHDCDWLVSDLVTNEGMWTYTTREHTVEGAWKYLHEHRDTPICSKAVWDVAWLRARGLSWYEWPHTSFAEDCRTEIEYLRHSPRIIYDPTRPFYGYRLHEGQDMRDEARRAVFVADLNAYLEGL